EHGSNSTRSVTVTLFGVGGRPRAVRSSRRAFERTSSRGLSFRTVVAPTRIASQEARSLWTRLPCGTTTRGCSCARKPRVVVPHGSRAHKDRVAGGAHGVDPVEVGVVR